MPGLKIGTLAERTGTNTPTIRYYEDIGLLPPAYRQQGGQRRYGAEDVKRLTLVRRCREFGFSIEQVRSLLALTRDPERSCLEARDLAREHLSAVRAKLHELRALERSIAGFVRTCESACTGGAGPDCIVLEELANASGTGMAATEAGRRQGRRPASTS